MFRRPNGPPGPPNHESLGDVAIVVAVNIDSRDAFPPRFRTRGKGKVGREKTGGGGGGIKPTTLLNATADQLCTSSTVGWWAEQAARRHDGAADRLGEWWSDGGRGETTQWGKLSGASRGKRSEPPRAGSEQAG